MTRRALLLACLMLAAALLLFAPHPVQAQEAAGPPARTGPREVLDAIGDGPSEVRGINPLEVLAGAGDLAAGAAGITAKGPTGPATTGLSAAMNLVIVLTLITLAPSIMLMTTCFVRIIVVLGLLKQAIGTQTLPPPQVIISLAIFMTMLVMSPTFDRINREAIQPYRAGEITNYDDLWLKARAPMRDFMFAQIDATNNWSAVYTVLQHRGVDTSRPEELTTDDVDMITLIPAFMLSELKTGFLIGFKVYLPFLVIDMVIASILIAMGMMMLPPVLISLPFKLLLFVLVDGWTLVIGSLLASFAQPEAAAVTAAASSVHPLICPLHWPHLITAHQALLSWV